ncbi:protein of unknown function DUF1350 [Thalassoporum mexicanum PCC 7367]|uniref:DUF1350 family protein n=1 Tax=Thalassoporum mexicanum TaxID=3457544 RepID=UPI00029FCCAD|nr:DUF1350 family protein [Pseudanabaena sp. PCC 7367]AFY68867.1 protein of unknown function DUF1350 [Pseudanabaena sp. PCC 7367]
MEWLQVEQNWVLTPPKPKGVIHFLGGAFFAAAPHIAYRRLLEKLASYGYVIVATPFANNTFDHGQIAAETYKTFQKARSKLFLDYFPVYGLGHSMGCKVHLLLNCYYNCDRTGNMFIAYNNYSAKRSVPFFKELAVTIPEMAEMEFYPSPEATRDLVDRQYKTRHNLLVRFFDDSIDEITDLSTQLKLKFPETVKVQALPGTHLTSMGIDFNWQAGNSFTPFDAIGQWLKQGVHKNNHTLEQVLLRWLATNNPDRKSIDRSSVAS